MINRERESRYLEKQQRRNIVRRGVTRVGEVVTSLLEKVSPHTEAEIIYAFPDRQNNLTKYYDDPNFFSYVPNPHNLPLFRIANERVARARQNGNAVSETAADTHRYRRGKAVVRTDHASDLARPGFMLDERAYRITGFETFFSEVLNESQVIDENKPTFKQIYYGDQGVELFRKDGTSVLISELFGPEGLLPNPLPEGAVIRFFDDEYVLEVTVLPVGKLKDRYGKITERDNLVPQLCLIGPAKKDKNNLDLVFSRARPKGGRILVVYKEGYEGLVHGFIQPDPGITDVYELVAEDKKKVKRMNGQPAKTRGLPPKSPGNIQIVLLPIKGKIETFVRDETDEPDILKGAAGVYGIDVIEWGTASAGEQLVPVHFRDDDAAHVSGNTILEWQKRTKDTYLYHGQDPYLDYVRANAIMPVQPVMIRVIRVKPEQTTDLPQQATVFEAYTS